MDVDGLNVDNINKIDNIIVLGTESCGLCKNQIQRLQDSFALNKISYLDLMKDEGCMDLAIELNLSNTPSTILISGSKIVSIGDGLSSVDKLFFNINKTIPVNDYVFERIKNNNYENILLSFNQNFIKNNIIKIETYNQLKSCKANIEDIKKLDKNEIIKNFGEASYLRYFRLNGKQNGYSLKIRGI